MPERKLADRIRNAIRLRGYSIRTEKADLHWYERFVHCRKLRHPAAMGAAEVEAFLTHLAACEQVSAATQNQALAAILFHDECLRILAELGVAPYLVACLLYGSGPRLLEALHLRIQDLDVENSLMTVRNTKSNRDRVTFFLDEVSPTPPCPPGVERGDLG